MNQALANYLENLKQEKLLREKKIPLKFLLSFLERVHYMQLTREETLDYQDPYKIICNWLGPYEYEYESYFSIPRFAWNYALNLVAEYTGIPQHIVYSTYWKLKGIKYHEPDRN